MSQRGMVLPALVMLIGGLCMIGGIALLVLRLADPEAAVQLIPGTATQMPPTPGFLLETPLAPPPLRDNAPIMPVMEVEEAAVVASDTPTPTLTATSTPSATSTATHTSTASPSLTPTDTSSAETSPQPIQSATITSSPTLTLTYTPIPFITPTPTITPTLTITPSPTITPSVTPTRLPREPARILIPAINLDAPVVSVWLQRLTIDGNVFSQWRVPDFRAAGWHNTSASLGQIGNTVLNGHHNTNGHVFADLVRVQPGDTIRLEAADHFGIDYIVVQTMILEEEGRSIEERLENARWLLPSDDERITLVTCWPPNGRSHRLVVVALPSEVVNTVQR